MMNLPDKIKSALATRLPGAQSHKKMLPPNRTLTAAPEEKSRVKSSSVLLLLCEEKGELMACLIKRPSHMKHHAGQIALPGGRIEKGETAYETALRETFEEIGIESTEISSLGSLSEFYIEVSRFQVHPFVGWLDKKPKFTINKGEVEKTILFPVRHFMPPYKEIELQTVSGKLNVPCVHFEDEIIWGATAMILSEFSDLLTQTNVIRG